MPGIQKYIGLVAMLFFAACTTMPNGPAVRVLPGSGKSFDQFRSDDASCRQYALEQIGGTTANQAANDSFVRSAAVGTAIGAVVGAAAGGHEGAGVGAATGLLVGSAAGANAGEYSSYASQQHYDDAYVQCMYAKGHRVPVSGRFVTEPRATTNYPPPPPQGYIPPPPPPGYVAPVAPGGYDR